MAEVIVISVLVFVLGWATYGTWKDTRNDNQKNRRPPR